MIALGNIKIVLKIGLIVAALGLQMIGQTWFAASRMNSIDESYSDVIGRLNKYAMLAVRAARNAEIYLSNALQLTAASTEQESAQLLAQLAENRRAYETQMAEVSKNLPEKATGIESAMEKYRQAFTTCDAVVQIIAAGADGRANASSRLKQECVPLIRAAAAVQRKVTGELSDDAARVSSELSEKTHYTILMTGVAIAGALLFSLAFAMWIGIAGLSSPINRLKRVMQSFANNDLSADVPGTNARDEIGDMARTVEVFKANALEVERLKQQQIEMQEQAAAQRKAEMQRLAGDFEASVGDVIQTVATAAGELESAARSLTANADRGEQLATTVASASEEASANVQSVASATEELTASINEIARRVQDSAGIAHQAVDQARQTNERFSELAKAASRIDDVVELINTIAGQTNLLALNATIEAARAGEAGRGFAVVASEVKALAEQTGKATDEISQQITGMQSATQESVAAIKEIGGTIERMAEISASIASAVEEQGAATRDISRNVQEASAGTTQVSHSISDVQQGANETGAASSRVLAAAQSLSRDSARLRSEVSQFLATVRAA